MTSTDTVFAALAACAWLESFGDEIALVWSSERKPALAMIVYALIRYATLAQYSMSIVPLGELPLLVRHLVDPLGILLDF